MLKWEKHDILKSRKCQKAKNMTWKIEEKDVDHRGDDGFYFHTAEETKHFIFFIR